LSINEFPADPGDFWFSKVGPLTSVRDAAILLGVTPQRVHHLISTSHVLALRLADTSPLYALPTWQFDKNLEAVMPQVLAAAALDPQNTMSGWLIAMWLTEQDEQLGYRTPLEALQTRDPSDTQSVLAAAAQCAHYAKEVAGPSPFS
jgi:hypothetical protein